MLAHYQNEEDLASLQLCLPLIESLITIHYQNLYTLQFIKPPAVQHCKNLTDKINSRDCKVILSTIHLSGHKLFD